MGISEIFTENADLGGLLESGERLPVSDVVHRTFFEIDEEGAEAVAVAPPIAIGKLSKSYTLILIIIFIC